MNNLGEGWAFIDTNVWFYAFTGNDPEKHQRAVEVIKRYGKSIQVSTQVINELCLNLKKKADFLEKGIREIIRQFFRKYKVIKPDEETMLLASELRERYRLSFWDSLIVAAALEGEAKILVTEDMHPGLVVEKLKIINPFLP
ncbi:PIN domain-containing protein [Thermosulfurimonas dismutans]|uniref:Programmed cell death toxin MazF like n=1 Tax=Thermosulfurimonas dismutans TaxID=999894 RepID=A0A179D227_9BACT|nr:PIN domain-containing protein [Thermosulfurimonas dismutans]OAQ19769.1 Programmed cell death toxin MazF like [Thermosulfurimonas dismutans]